MTSETAAQTSGPVIKMQGAGSELCNVGVASKSLLRTIVSEENSEDKDYDLPGEIFFAKLLFRPPCRYIFQSGTVKRQKLIIREGCPGE
jgi:hypothetical protein